MFLPLNVPAAGGEVVRINLYVYGWGKRLFNAKTKFVVEKFRYYP